MRELTCREVGDALGVSAMAVSQLEKRALEKIRRALREKGIDRETVNDYLSRAEGRQTVWDKILDA